MNPDETTTQEEAPVDKPAPTPVVLDEITLNDTVEVKPNAHGQSIYAAYLKSHGIESPNKTPDTLKLQLWEMSAIFGPHIGYGKQTPFDTKMKHTGRRGTALRTLERYKDSSIPDVEIRKPSAHCAVSTGQAQLNWSLYDFMRPYLGESYDEMYRAPVVGMSARFAEARIMAEEAAASAAATPTESHVSLFIDELNSAAEAFLAHQPQTTAEMPATF